MTSRREIAKGSRAERGEDDSADRMLQRIRHLKSTLKSRETTTDPEVWLSLRQQRGRRLRAQAQVKELQLATARGQLISLSQWQHELCAKVLIVRQNLMSISRRIAAELEDEPPHMVEARLRQSLKQVVSSL